LKVITLNVNGIRSAATKGLFRWLEKQQADVVCLQELKCHETDLDAKLHGLKAFESCHAFAKKKGYSGVALYSRKTPDEIVRGFRVREFDAEGRYVEGRFGKLWWYRFTCPPARRVRTGRHPSCDSSSTLLRT